MDARPLIFLVWLQSSALAQGSLAPPDSGTSDAAATLAAANPAVASTSTHAGPTAPSAPATGSHPDSPNPSIDMAAFLRISADAAAYRASHRLSEEDFLRMSHEAGAIVLDARSASMFGLLHVKGAINLSFPDITVDSLRRTIPDKSTRVLIYCNNNFTGAQKAFPTKLPGASLNLSTYVALYTYGYRNLYELGPTVDLKASKLAFEGSP